jgi:hypothetical protein
MARGWESKDVESQVADARSGTASDKFRTNAEPSAEQKQRSIRIEALELDLLRIDTQLAAESNFQRREQLESARQFLLARLEEFRKPV